MFCPKCGSQNADTNKFCKKCGKNLPVRAQGVPQGFGAQHSPGFVGQTLDGRYRIDAKLGSGGMGDVYRATRLLIGDVVAVKILHPHLARDPQAAERFRREAVMATKLRHRNVVGIYDVGISAAHNVPYILMELAEGYTLRQMINQYRVLPLDFAVTVTTQVCSALDEAHALGIVHRDIKPENIVANQTTTGWYIKVLDFGIAKLYNQGDIGLTLDGSAMGTPQYMSPEQCMGEDLDARSDIYSVGIMLYEMLTGTVPFKSPTASAIAIHQVQTAPQPLRAINGEIHPAVEEVVLKSLAKQREPRQQKASQLAQELIQSATLAFKSGFTAVPVGPIPEPDVTPEFSQSDEASSLSSGSATPAGGTGPETLVVDEEPLHVLEPKTKVEKKPKRTRSKKKVEIAEVQEIPVEPPGESPIHPATVFEPDLLDGSNVESDGFGREDPNAETQVVEVVSNENPGSGDTNDPLIPPKMPETEDTLQKDDLAGFVEDAELRLDEILSDEKQSTRQDAESNAVGEPESNKETPLDTVEPDPPVEMPASIGEADEIPAFAMASETTNNKKKLTILIAASVAVLSVGVISFGYLFIASGTPEQPTNNATQTAVNSSSVPIGMALVTGGEFMMGSDAGDENSQPAHKVTVKPFFMDITEVTNEEYKKFVDAANYKAPPGWKNGTFPDGKSKFPVTGVNWDDANAYATWAKKRLPTEEEWEFAARGTDGRKYPWGNDWKTGFANAGPTRGLREVGQGDGKSPFGMLDLVGNAWEWTSSDFGSYPGGKLTNPTEGSKVLRGGCYLSKKDVATTTYRFAWPARGASEYDETSFRCAKDAPTTSQ